MSSAEERMWEIARGFQASRILLTAVELGLFTALADGPKSSGQIAELLSTNVRATDRLMNALVALHLLRKEGANFFNTEDGSKYLVYGQPQYLGGAMRHTANLWHAWSTLTEAVRQGTKVHRREQPSEWVSPFIAAMHYNAMRRAADVVALINLDKVKTIIDVGGGSGEYAMAFCRAKPGLTATVFDLPEVLELTKEYVARAGLSERVEFVAGDYHERELGGGFDLAWFSAVIHSNSAAQNALLLKRAALALNPGGRVVIQDFVMDENRTRPIHGTFFALNMLVNTDGGDTFTEQEILSWFTEAGLRLESRRESPDNWTTLLTARKQ